jgi:hypothetical protein
MPVIHLEYDDKKISDEQAEAVSVAVRDIVSKLTKIDDVFVYANTAKIKVQTAPIEFFVQMSSSKIDDLDTLVLGIKTEIKKWKSENNFTTPVNLSFIPMNWKIELNI